MVLRASLPLPRAALDGRFGVDRPAARAAATRRTLNGGRWLDLPLYRTEDQANGAAGDGPAVLEEAYYTCRIGAGWHFECDPSGDIMLTHDTRSPT